MENEKYNLLMETLKFLELCQLYLKNGKIGLSDYISMTGIKFQFISSVIREDGVMLSDSSDLRNYLNEIFTNHWFISNPVEETMRC